MKYTVRHIKDLSYQVNLVPETPDEHNMIKNASLDFLEYYFHQAVLKTLGPSANLLLIENDQLLPYSVIGKIEKAIGLGS